MAALSTSLRITIPNGAAWRTCDACGELAALAPDVAHCTPRRRKARRVTR